MHLGSHAGRHCVAVSEIINCPHSSRQDFPSKVATENPHPEWKNRSESFRRVSRALGGDFGGLVQGGRCFFFFLFR